MTDIDIRSVNREGDLLAFHPKATLDHITWELNRPGEAVFSVPALAPGADQIQLFSTEVQIWIDQSLDWWGVPWRESGFQNMEFTCEGLLSLIGTRIIDRSSLDYTSGTTDQLQIGNLLIQKAQDETFSPNMDYGITAAAFSNSGKTRPELYERDEHANILDLLYAFTLLADGYDYEVKGYANGQRNWIPYYPAQGSVRNDIRLRLDQHGAEGIEEVEDYAEDALPIATDVYSTGGSNAAGQKAEAHYVDETAGAANNGHVQKVVSEGSFIDPDWLLARAQEEAAKFSKPVQTYSLGLQRRFYKNIVLGDSIPVYIDYGRAQVDSVARVQSITWRPSGPLSVSFMGVTG